MSEIPNRHHAWSSWGLRPIILFAAMNTMVGILHESAHAATAYALHVPSTLFHLYANIDRRAGTLNEHALIGAAGPLFAFGLGLLGWLVYRGKQDSRFGLPLLYLTMFGMGTLFGNLLSTAFVGDFSRAAQAFQWPMPARYAASLVGALLLCGLSFFIGTELRRWAPVGIARLKAMMGMVALPAIAGTAIVLLVHLPMPAAFAASRAGESVFWIFAAAGVMTSRKQPAQTSQNLGVSLADFALLLLAVSVVRVMAGGIVLAP